MNTIMDRLSRSWELFKCSLRMMRDHPKLLVFPLLINLFTFVILLFFFIPVAVAFLMSAGVAAWFGPHGPLGHVALPPWFLETFRAFSGPFAMAAFAAFYLASWDGSLRA